MNLPPMAPRAETPARKCATCAFFEKDDDEIGACHRNAPKPAMACETSDNVSPIVVWPEVYFNDFCGEWSQS